ncbi:alpha-beta hydrolase superfamily lysophospholipase [Halohasta litchfieldiae]|uniref:Lysophospholipase, alpha-beta hydrolase superfamily n=1 Tax=Halohasta litchfieldiae TaxID=1073996 RepID=A0A1H6XG56_9EURY|nr:alpha/beta fold hydrolase [Halohasta litchfieldiae]ATW87299.1 alpha-beta hydrolase superfamily lysophospholipase [Halohasta litchfieldiae]SEJ23822.1 Lysophospholipase, alpha-beta hydrolase superfamily [Halohasta litchfieldiae]
MTEFVRADQERSAASEPRQVSSRPSSRRKPQNRSQQSLRRPSREAYSTRTIEFDSDGETCVGTLYLPDRPESPPVIVMAPGLGFWRTFALPAVAERFAESGYAAFTFDFRHHGDSEGEPRGLVSPPKQIADYEAAIEAMGREEDVDSNRLVVWGHSLSGGHVLSVAAENFRVAGVIATNPFVDGRSQTLGRIRQPKRLLKSLVAGLRDAIGHRLGFGTDVRIVDDEDGFAVITAPGAKRAVFDLVDRHADWQNRVPARILLALPRYRPITGVEEIRCPTLVIGGRDDQVIPAEEAESAADKIADSTYLELPVDHMSVFGEDFETIVGHQLAFLRTVVGHR